MLRLPLCKESIENLSNKGSLNRISLHNYLRLKFLSQSFKLVLLTH